MKHFGVTRYYSSSTCQQIIAAYLHKHFTVTKSPLISFPSSILKNIYHSEKREEWK